MDKKALYESIMENVAKEVKKALNEGTWGYEPLDSDYYWDDTHKLCSIILNFLNDNLKECEYKSIGLVNECLKANIWNEMYKDDQFNLMIQNFYKAYDVCKKNSNEWEEPKKFLNELEKLKTIFEQKIKQINNE